MPKVSVYLPDELYREAKAKGLPISALAQEAIERALRDNQREEWVARVRARPRRVNTIIDTAAIMDEVREEFGA
ncbi:MAG: type II toxin-antitoxin system CcdA family antitoxin [Pseudonocardia sp.]|nr:type II toxin-antitoxin system CcdA family antitoxin [Pseudonocardia sp.]